VKPQKINIVSEEHRRRVIRIIECLPLVPIAEVVIKEHKKDRSAEQNSLYWKWITIIADSLGETKEQLHEIYKDRFLVQIYERDDPEFSEMISSLRAIYRQGMKVEALALRKRIVALTSTTTATVAQFTEYLDDIQKDANSLSIRLPSLEDI